MGLLSQLNCFSKSKKAAKDSECGDNERLLLPSSHPSSPSRKASEATSKSSKYSPQSSNGTEPHNYDDVSIPTVDPDYNNIQSSNFSLSDAGGTVGTQAQSLSNFSHAGTAFGSVAPPPTGGNNSQHQQLYSSHLIGSPQPPPRRKEEILEVYAPRGKLGLVIDTPSHSSTPVVHAIKDTCPIRNEIFVGDRLVAVDEVDVREMGAVQVSKLIGHRKEQERRKLTIVRGGVGVGSGGY